MTTSKHLYHLTHYEYDRAVQLSPHVVRLKPSKDCRTPITNYHLNIQPIPHSLNWLTDFYGNDVAQFDLGSKTESLIVEVHFSAAIDQYQTYENWPSPDLDIASWHHWHASAFNLSPYLGVENVTPLLGEFLNQWQSQRAVYLEDLQEINQGVYKAIRYVVREEAGVQTPEQTLTEGSGSCRDSAWLLIHVLRHQGIAARFVSGYLLEDAQANEHQEMPRTNDLHAWCEVHIPEMGWVGLDPTSGQFTGAHHIPVAYAPEPMGAAPIFGYLDECQATLQHTIKLT